MPSETNTVIGYLVDVQGNQLVATLIEDEQGHVPIITIGDEDIAVGQIGSYVVIRQGSVQIIAMVTRMTEQESFATPTIETPGEPAARLPYAKRIARLTPIGSINSEELFRRGVGQYPTTGAEVHAIGSEEIRTMLGEFRTKGFEVGKLTTHPSIRVSLHASNLFGRHLAILGQTGSGKSWTVASLVQKAVKEMPKAHIIILDLHGEYCWKHDDNNRHYAFEDDIVRHVDARDLEMPYWLMTYA
ncbi:MAG: ATP-binding protein, partial [Syntrophaceae bacterium]|nr:ATP-binding protein [Syntrophaceae bacterium]